MASMTDTATRYFGGTITWRRPAFNPVRAGGPAARVAYFMNLFPNLTETFVYREVDSVRAQGIEVVVFAIRRPNPEEVSREARHHFRDTRYVLPLSLGDLIREHARCFAARPGRYLRIAFDVVAGTHERGRDRLRSLCHFVEAISLARVIETGGIRHLHAHFAVGSATCVWVLARYLDLPFSFTAHAYDIWLDRLLLPEKLRDASFVVTCTEENRRHLLDTYPRARARIDVIHHGVDSARFRPAERRRRGPVPRILSVGRLCEQKGFETLLRACALLIREAVTFECHIVGDGPLADRLHQLAAELEIGSHVRFLGRAFQEELPAYYAEADVFALACTRASDNDRDGIPNTLMEAMASGLPVVSTYFSGIPELVLDGNTGLLAPPDQPEKLMEALRRLLRDEPLRRRLGDAGRRRVMREFSLEGAAASLVDRFRHTAPDILDATSMTPLEAQSR